MCFILLGKHVKIEEEIEYTNSRRYENEKRNGLNDLFY